jgi:WD40 repeat protein
MQSNQKTFIAMVVFVCFTAFLNGQSLKQEIKVQSGHNQPIDQVEFSPDGNTFVSCSIDNTIKVWDVSTGKEIRSISVPDNLIRIALLPDGKSVISASYSGILRQWNLETGKEIKVFKGHSKSVGTLGISADGKILASGSSDRNIKLWDIESGQELKTLSGHTSAVVCLAITPDGKTIISAEYNEPELKFWDVESGEEVKTVTEHTKLINCLRISHDGKLAISGSDDNTIVLWNIEKKKAVKTLKGHTFGVHDLAFSPDGNTFVSGSWDNTIKLWSTDRGKELKTFTGHPDKVKAVAFSPDGKSMVSGSADKTLKLWDIESGKEIKTFTGHSDMIYSLGISRDGKTIISGSGYYTNIYNPRVKLWDYEGGNPIKSMTGHKQSILTVAISPDNKTAVSGSLDKTIIKWDVESGKEILINKDSWEPIENLVFSADGKTFLSSARDKKIILWDAKSFEKIRTFTGHTWHVSSLAYLPDGKTILSSSWDKTLRIWYIETGEQINSFTGHTKEITTMALSPDGKKAVTGSEDMTLKLWEIKNGKEIITLMGHTGIVNSVAYSPTGTVLVSGSNDNTVKIWEVASGKEIRTLEGHGAPVLSVIFSPDGKTIISGSQDNTIKVWDATSGELIYTTVSYIDGSEWLVFNNEGYWDASPNGGELVAMVQGMENWNIDQFAVKNNRPDLIMKRIPNMDPVIISHYYKQYQKRLRKLGLTETNLSDNNETPETKITNAVQNDKMVNLDFTLSRNKAKITRYNIFVNNIPIFGAYGKELSNSKKESKTIDLSETTELIAGDNKIEISATNENGAESFRALTYVKYEKPVQPNLFYLGFGVSTYKNPELNLGYAHKDALDLEKTFQQMKGNGFENVFTKTYINEQVTSESIKAAKDFLKNAKPDDVFVLFIAGHGMHDSDAEATYYYLTYNTDLKNLAETAANFDFIEDLLQGIPPRNKLFLMDACESGEIDDYVAVNYLATTESRGLKSRGFKSNGQTNQTQPAKRNYLFQKNRYIYNDLLRRSGAIVFSSSKGGELSYEFSNLENGLFTENIMKALTTSEADKDGNGTVSTDELREYVSAQVAKASGDLQHPTVDRDNIYQKFGFQVKR